MVQLFMITNDPREAKQAVFCGVDRIFVDLEFLGKKVRQQGKNSWMSHHTIDDVDLVRSAIPGGELLVRINPVNENTKYEIEEVIKRGADYIMLPMFRSLEEVEEVRDFIDGRVAFVPLIETVDSLGLSCEIVKTEGVSELFLGLNDLHLDMGQRFMFEPLIDGSVDFFSEICRSMNVAFGFGGIARMDEGEIPGWLVLSEHVRLGSDRVILSRTFRREEDGQEDWLIFKSEIEKLRKMEKKLRSLSSDDLLKHQREIHDGVRSVLESRL